MSNLHKKTAPGVPGTMLKEPKLYQKVADLLAEVLETVLITVAQDFQRVGKVQAYHANEAFGVDNLPVVAHKNLEGLHCGRGNKFPNFPKGANIDVKFLHKLPPDAIQRRKKRV